MNQLRETRLINRNLSFFQSRDPVLVFVHTDYLEPELRETRACDEAHIPSADHADVHDLLSNSTGRMRKKSSIAGGRAVFKNTTVSKDVLTARQIVPTI